MKTHGAPGGDMCPADPAGYRSNRDGESRACKGRCLQDNDRISGRGNTSGTAGSGCPVRAKRQQDIPLLGRLPRRAFRSGPDGPIYFSGMIETGGTGSRYGRLSTALTDFLISSEIPAVVDVPVTGGEMLLLRFPG